MPNNNYQRLVYVPLAFAELLHATLGPLGDVLSQEGHTWAPMVQRVLAEYTSRRDDLLTEFHGEGIVETIHDHTLVAAEEVEGLAHDAIDTNVLRLVAGEFE